MEEKSYYVHILASGQHGALYVGVTNSLERRIAEHRAKQVAGFTKKYDVDRLVWWMGFGEITERSPWRRSSSAGGVSGRST